MRFSHFFIARPIFASVVSLIILIVGAIAYSTLPVSQFPDIVPPTISVTATFPGANAVTVADTVASVIEQEVNGVEGMIYMYSQSTDDGTMSLSVTFEVGTDIDKAQVLVQNRVAVAEPRLPEEVRRNGIVVNKRMPDLLLVVHLVSPQKTYDQVYSSNYALLNVRDELARIPGVGDVSMFGSREYSMRVWLDPERIALRGMTANEVLSALRAQNIQVAGGALGRAAAARHGRLPAVAAAQGSPAGRERVREHRAEDGTGRPRRAREGRRPRRARRAELHHLRLPGQHPGDRADRHAAARLERDRDGERDQENNAAVVAAVPQGPRVPHRL